MEEISRKAAGNVVKAFIKQKKESVM